MMAFQSCNHYAPSVLGWIEREHISHSKFEVLKAWKAPYGYWHSLVKKKKKAMNR